MCKPTNDNIIASCSNKRRRYSSVDARNMINSLTVPSNKRRKNNDGRVMETTTNTTTKTTTTTTESSDSTRRRKVRFGTNCNVDDQEVNVEIFLDPTLRYSSNMTKVEKQQRWYQRHETISFWKNANATSVCVKRKDRQQKNEQEETTITGSNPCSYTNLMLRVFDASCQFTDKYRQYDDDFFALHYKDTMLLEYYCNKWDVRGLERMSIPELSMLRSKRKRTTVQGVLHAQQILSNRTDMSKDDKIRIIRRSSEKYSRPGRLYARTMALADATAAATYYPTRNYSNNHQQPRSIYDGVHQCQSKVDFEPPTMAKQQKQPNHHHQRLNIDCGRSFSNKNYHATCITKPHHHRAAPFAF